MKKIKEFLSKHWIGVWFWVSILYALAIHWAFSQKTDKEYLIAHWGAGDILTYASTVSLGLLALWQNKKIQEENEVAQTRLENIINRNNELETISKIIEYEERNISEFKLLANEFITNCSPQSFGLSLSENVVDYMQNITELEQRVDKDYYSIREIVRVDDGVVSKDSLLITIDDMYEYTKKSISDIRTNRMDLMNNRLSSREFIAEMMNKGKLFMDEKEKYLVEKNNRLNSMLLHNISLEEIRDKFNVI